MTFKFVIKGFTIPAVANKPIVTFLAGTGKPFKFLRIEIGPRGSASGYQDFQLRKVSVAETGGTAVNATADDDGWTAAPGCVCKKGTFTADPTLGTADAAGNEGGAWTFNAVGYLPYTPVVPERVAPGNEWALCTGSGGANSIVADITVRFEE